MKEILTIKQTGVHVCIKIDVSVITINFINSNCKVCFCRRIYVIKIDSNLIARLKEEHSLLKEQCIYNKDEALLETIAQLTHL